MDRVTQLRGETGGCGDSTLDTTSPPSEAYMSANDTSKYFSIADSTFDITPIKDVSLASTSADPDLLSPIPKTDNYNIGKQIEAANILSGGVNIFDDNDNSFDGDELVIDDNVEMDDKSIPEKSDLIGDISDPTLVESSRDVASKDMEVVLQIDGRNVNAIDIGNGLYLYRKDGQEELAAVQIIDGDQPQPSFKFLKVRENAEGNLEVYEEIEIEVPKQVPTKQGKTVDKNSPRVPSLDINKVVSDSSTKVTEKNKSPQKETIPTTTTENYGEDTESKEVNFNAKMKISESRKSPVVGSFTPMTFHSTPNKEGKPLTKTMVDLQLDPNRHTDNVKKTIELHTDSKQKSEPKDNLDNTKSADVISNDKEISLPLNDEPSNKVETERLIPDVEKGIKNISDGSSSKKLQEKADGSGDKDNITSNSDGIEIQSDHKKDDLSESTQENKIKLVPDVIAIPKENPVNKFEAVKEDNAQGKGTIKGNVVSAPSTTIISSKMDENEDIKSNTDNKTIYEKNSEVLNATALKKDYGIVKESTNKEVVLVTDITKPEKQNASNNIPVKIDDVGGKPKTTSSLQQKEKEETVPYLKVEETEKVPQQMPVKEGITFKPNKTLTKSQESKDSLLENSVSNTSKSLPDEAKTESLTIKTVSSDTSVTVQSNAIEKGSNIISTTYKEKEDINSASSEKSNINEKSKQVTFTATSQEKVVSKDQVASTKIIRETSISEQEAKSIEKDYLKVENKLKTDQLMEVKSSEPQQDSIIITEIVELPTAKTLLPDKLDPIPVSKAKVTDIPEPAIPITSKFDTPAKPTEKPTSHLPVPKEIKPNIPVPKVKASETTADIVIPKANPTAPAIPVLKVKATEPIGHIKKIKAIEPKQAVLPKVKAVEITAQTILAPKLKTTESGPTITALKLVGQTTSIPKVKTTELITISQPKAHTAVKTEVKVLEVSKPSNTKASSEMVKISKTTSKVAEVKPKTEDNKNEESRNKEIMITKNKIIDKVNTQVTKTEPKEPINTESKPVNNNHTAAVPFGKWTEVNRQEFLNKFKEVKAPVNTNSKQIKNSNDLNRRDVLKKIDSQRQTIINNAISKAQEKPNIKKETVFSSKVVPEKTETEIVPKNEIIELKPKQTQSKVMLKQEPAQKPVVSSTVTIPAAIASATKVEPVPRRKSTATMASLIDRTIEDMITRVVPCPVKTDEVKETDESDVPTQKIAPKLSPKPVDDSTSLDDIEMKMNELHGIPFVERPPHELPKVLRPEIKTYSKSDKASSKVTKASSTVSTTEPKTELKTLKDNLIGLDSDEEVIEHEPITGDMEMNKKPILNKTPQVKTQTSQQNNDTSKKEAIITENDFDKFARRNSITYENCLTVNYDKKEPHTVIQTVKEKEPIKPLPKNEITRVETKSKLTHKQPLRQNIHVSKPSASSGLDASNKHQSKIHTAYQALTAKRQVNPPITILEDKPVKVVFLESSTEFVASQLNAQGLELSPPKKVEPKIDVANSHTTSDNALETSEDNKQEKIKTKHQRKQVLTPVEAPELELIQPGDIGIEVSPKKKRKIEEHKSDKQSKNMVPKKSYLLGRNTTTTDDKGNDADSANDSKETKRDMNIKQSGTENVPEHKNAASAIDSLVKAAELLDQSETLNQSIVSSNSDSQQSTPVKRGRGRPRKYPLPEGAVDKKQPTPQKKPRLIDAKPIKQDSFSDDDGSDEVMFRENWTMGKINENIVCPICNKLFRSENVVFKHVKHCTGVSPNRSESDKSPRRGRKSQDFDDLEDDENSADEIKKKRLNKRNSKESAQAENKSEDVKAEEVKDDVIIIEDTPVKEKTEKPPKEKDADADKASKPKFPLRNNMSCEICGKTFRQQSYLANHKLQHKRDQTKKLEKDKQDSHKPQVFSCEVCNKDFRKLHHLVQHRIIHNPDSAPTRTLRKSSSEQNETKNIKEEVASKQNDDQNAAFRCEPCDKSFRKLHHLVEHRETHDGINRQKITAPVQPPIEKTDPPPQCEICKKTFRKLHHLIEHKEQHADVASDKSDDKSEGAKSALSTKDIIHECSLCYMVFPNEHSLNKHSTLCAKKKRQSKQPKVNIESESEQKDKIPEDTEDIDSSVKPKTEEIVDNEEIIAKQSENIQENTRIEVDKIHEVVEEEVIEVNETEKISQENKSKQESEVKTSEPQTGLSKRNLESVDKVVEKAVIPEKIKKIDHKEEPKIIQETSKKKTPLKNKVAPTVSKRQKSTEVPAKVENETKPSVESSDDDDIRYMLNPNYKANDISESKKFMKIRASKRNSLQIERTTSKEFVNRRPSLQNPPKLPRLKPKPVETKVKTVETKPKAVEPKIKPKPVESKSKPVSKPLEKSSTLRSQKVDAVLSTDSDDSDVKYSFPKPSKMSKLAESVAKEEKNTEKKVPKKSLAEKRKSLTGIAKRKSLGKAAAVKQRINVSQVKIIRKRTAEIEHRCDCGELFSSAALLSRHTSLAHTPPRIRRRRSPTHADNKPIRQSSLADKTNRKSTETAKPPTRKSSVKTDANKAEKSEPKSATKTRRSAPHRGVPVPDKMRKLLLKNIK